MTKAEEILENLPSVKIGLDDHYGKQTVLNALNQALSMSGVSESWLDSKWNEYRLLTNNEDAWCFKEWLKSHVR